MASQPPKVDDLSADAELAEANVFIDNLLKTKTTWEPGQKEWLENLSDTDKKQLKGSENNKISILNMLLSRDAPTAAAAAGTPPVKTTAQEIAEGDAYIKKLLTVSSTGDDVKQWLNTLSDDIKIKIAKIHTDTDRFNMIKDMWIKKSSADSSGSGAGAPPPVKTATQEIADGDAYIKKLLTDPTLSAALQPEVISWLPSLLDEDKQKIGKIPSDKDRAIELGYMYAGHEADAANAKVTDIVASLVPLIGQVKIENKNVKDAFEKANSDSSPNWDPLKTALTKGNEALDNAKKKYSEYLEAKQKPGSSSSTGTPVVDSKSAPGKVPIEGDLLGLGGGRSTSYSKKNRKSHTASHPRSRRTRKHSSSSSSHHKKMKFVHHS
jgi:hypothetical protein